MSIEYERIDLLAKKIFEEAYAELTGRAEDEYKAVGEGHVSTARYLDDTALHVVFVYLMKHISVLRKWHKTPAKLALRIVRHRVIDAINFLVILLFMWNKELEGPPSLKDAEVLDGGALCPEKE